LKTATKIRWLLLLVTIGLFATALTAKWASTRSLKLERAAQKISNKLIKKEKIIYDYINNPDNFNKLKSINIDSDLALSSINYFSSKNIYFQTFKNNKLSFWSDARVSEKYAVNLKEGIGFIGYSNGWYEVIKKGDDSFFVIFYILVKANFPFQNQYFNYNSGDDIISSLSVDIAELSDTEVSPVKTFNNKYLFSIKKTEEPSQKSILEIEILLWFLGFVSLFLLINSICKYYADKGLPIIAGIALTISLFLIRFLCLKFNFPQVFNTLEVFSPAIYASSDLAPSLGDLGLNFITALWCTIFIYSYKEKIYRPINNKIAGYFTMLICAVIIIAASYLLSGIFRGLVHHSNINFKITNLVNLDIWSIAWIIILLTSVFIYYLVLDFLICLTTYIRISLINKIIFASLILLVFSVYQLIFHEYSIYFLLVFFLILIIGLIAYQFKGVMVFPALVLTALIMATIISLKLNNYKGQKEREFRKLFALKLESVDDPRMLILFKNIEKKSLTDTSLVHLFAERENSTRKITNLFRTRYLNKSLNGYEVKILAFDSLGRNFGGQIKEKLSDYRELVESGALKVSNNFYRVTNTFGIQNYFAILPVRNETGYLGSIILELRYKHLRGAGNFPLLFKNEKSTFSNNLAEYSYAYYINNKLVYQTGDYVYKLIYDNHEGKTKEFTSFKEDAYSHLVYKPVPNKLIIVSKEINTFWKEIASLSFFFILFLVFGMCVLSYKWSWNIISSYKFSFNKFKIRLQLSNNKMLYKTRIQIALVLAVVTSLIIVGLITFSYISIQYKEQQEALIKDRIKTITKAFENKIEETGNYLNPAEDIRTFKEFSILYNTDLNLYDKNGRLIISTQPEIYDLGILSTHMNPVALVYMNMQKKSEFLQNENIGELNFISAYMPIQNSFNNVVGYLQLPYFANENDFNQRISNFLNLLINIYVLVFVAIGFFAFVVANQITSPLTLIQENMANMAIGKKNKPIFWSRNDEIGNLISEYNKMILALDESANRLARSERETAWREMAKQVAHEIKNPLTPLRLGIQMLERSWREKDPNFDTKFNNFSQSFLEQIDSLSRIASEFSNFAKMPDLKLEKLELIEVLHQAIQVYRQMDHIQIFCNEEKIKGVMVKADRDQLLRSFNNLLKNAIEAIAENKDGVITIHCEVYQEKIEIHFEDNGAGIPEDLRGKIFTPNFTTKSSGTGLGLAFVKQAIENMGGNIYFTTTIDVGTTFHISLPLVK